MKKQGLDCTFILRWAKKLRAVEHLGGKCLECGETNIFLLEFHHRDQQEKDFGISGIKAHMPWSTIEKEINKCNLLCRKCHTLFHLAETIERYNKFHEKIIEKSKVVHKVTRPALDKERIYKWLKDKKSIVWIAVALKKDPSTILEIARQLEKRTGEKLFVRRDEYNLSKKKVDFDKLIELYKDGKTIAEMGQYFGAAYQTIAGRLTKLRKKGADLDITKHKLKVLDNTKNIRYSSYKTIQKGKEHYEYKKLHSSPYKQEE